MNEDSLFLDFTHRLEKFIQATARDDDVTDLRLDESAFNDLALELFKLQHAHVPAYRRFCDARGVDAHRLDRWSQIPAVPASGFKELDLTSLPPAERVLVFESSGTTGQRPSRHYHDRNSLALYETSLLAWFRRHCPVGQSSGTGRRWGFLALTPPPEAAPGSSLAHMGGTVIASLRDVRASHATVVDPEQTWHLDHDLAWRTLEQARDTGSPLFLFGTAFTFVHLLDHLAERGSGLPLPPGSGVMETGGYKGRSRSLPKPELYRLLDQHLGIPESHIVSEYGMSELSSQAYDAVLGQTPKPDRVFRFPPWARSIVVSPEDEGPVAEGETGLLRICDLANIRSVLALQTEDLAQRRGTGFELIGRAPLAEPRGCSLRAA